MASRTGRQAVYVVTPPSEWKPQRPWSLPPTFTDGRLIGNKQSPADAAGFARLFNKDAMEISQRTKQPIAQWAVVFRYLKASWQPMDGQGGAV
jgi:hypothetical protein